MVFVSDEHFCNTCYAESCTDLICIVIGGSYAVFTLSDDNGNDIVANKWVEWNQMGLFTSQWQQQRCHPEWV